MSEQAVTCIAQEKGAAVGKRNNIALLLIALAIMFDGFDIQLMGYVMPALLSDWKVERLLVAPVLMAGLVGMIIGSGLAGVLGDSLGRKLMLIVSLFVIGIATIACAYAGNPKELAIGRFVTGMGMGGAVPNAIALIFTIAPARLRVFLVAVATVFVPVGGALAGLVAAQFMPDHGWPFMFLIGGAMPLVLAIAMVPALKVPRQVEVALTPVQQDTDVRVGVVDRRSSRALIAATAALCTAFFACLFGLYSLLNWLPALIDQAGMGGRNASLALSVVNIGGIVSALLVGWISAKIGPKRPLVVMFIGGAAAAAGLAWLASTSAVSFAVLAIALLFVGVATAGAQSILLAFAADIYEERYRATGVGCAVGVGRLGGIASAFAGAILLGQVDAIQQFFLVEAIILVIAALAVITIRPYQKT